MAAKHYIALWLILCLAPLSLFASEPPLLPMPKVVTWGEGYLTLDSLGDSIDAPPELQKYSSLISSEYPLGGEGGVISLSLGLKHSNREAYRLEVSREGIKMQAVEPIGIFYAIQTLRQLYDPEQRGFRFVAIEDYPAFPWRGYMIDVGRNYQRVELIKEQIDVMAALKLNIFHFHLTEDVAWRLEIKQYPQLTDPKSMTRDHGLFYSEAEVKELQHYCSERGITLVPEIDMPGHSKAFERAMGFGMQTPEGREAVLNILREVTETYDFPIIHIGGDEVQITDSTFLPEMIRFLEQKGITVVGWQPGGNLTSSTLRQLWGEDSSTLSSGSSLRYIDSRNLYTNHHDPFEAIPLIFNHQIGGVDQATDRALGATLCLWNDRRLRRGEDNLLHNPLYPSLFAFAERCWRGDGNAYSYVGIQKGTLQEFANLEERMLALREKQFPHLPFQYYKQSDISWNIYGPYDNEGQTDARFAPELVPLETLTPDTTLVGATIILRHFWHPAVRGHFQEARANTTYYASRKVWSDQEREAEMWIGFYDFSRSTATPTPAEGTWNNYDAKIWVNGEEIAPPHWLRAGQDGGNNEYPYEDENYFIRPPHRVHLHYGWNEILVKAPIPALSSGIWYAPNKWMFTAIILP
ncbi:family 20 glycosylhydrolase [uncultured Porphyromonas sp.]|uniref:family 20 glycosylhydrolase n=1 Tax=uncultured Porphyromonas sp. TaxID=159274 RepID=UPI0026333FDF|nr:family 20 glycosylhydrolase [uncultured Porphyromonas sp.]